MLQPLYPLILLNKLKLPRNFISAFLCVALLRQLSLFVTLMKLWCPFKLHRVEADRLER